MTGKKRNHKKSETAGVWNGRSVLRTAVILLTGLCFFVSGITGATEPAAETECTETEKHEVSSDVSVPQLTVMDAGPAQSAPESVPEGGGNVQVVEEADGKNPDAANTKIDKEENEKQDTTGSDNADRSGSENAQESGNETVPGKIPCSVNISCMDGGTETVPEKVLESGDFAGSGIGNGNEPVKEKESEGGSESESESESEKESESESESESENPRPSGQYLVSIKDCAVCLPEGGRVYDGTDRIEVTFNTELTRVRTPDITEQKADKASESAADIPGDQPSLPEEKEPEYHVTCSARLAGPDAGIQKVLCSFSLETPYPENVKLDESASSVQLDAEVRKAVLSVTIADGKKTYGEPADIKHIRFDKDDIILVSGFVKDENGQEIIPDGFKKPEVEVDSKVLEQWSPIYEVQKEVLSDSQVRHKYKKALVMKRTKNGKLTGDATANYEFCSDPSDPRYRPGTVTVERASLKRGESYTVSGEPGAYVIAGDGTVTVRQGSWLKVEPVAKGYNTGAEKENIAADGIFRFSLSQRTEDGKLLAESKEDQIVYRVDNEAPKAEMSVQGAQKNPDACFSSSGAKVKIDTPQDEVSGIESVRFRILSCALTNETASGGGAGLLSQSGPWQEIGTEGIVSLDTEQVCRIEAEVRDRVGNVSLTISPVIVIDHTSPKLEIKGVTDQSANRGSVVITVGCKDETYRKGSLSATLESTFGGVKVGQTLYEEDENSASIRFDDFPKSKAADAIYTLSVDAEDKAGNNARRQITFSVNRFGSAYSLAPSTKEQLKKYYHTKPFDVTFLETNLDEVGGARVLLRCGGEMKELGAKNLSVRSSLEESGRHSYAYTVPAGCFSSDGEYEVMLLTQDRAGNSADSSSRLLPVRFAIDTTKPECLVSGIDPDGQYHAGKVTAVIEVRDNLELEKADIYLNSRILQSVSAEKLKKSMGLIRVTLPEKEEWQTLQVRVQDRAGHVTWSREYTVYVSSTAKGEAVKFKSGRLSAMQLEQLGEDGSWMQSEEMQILPEDELREAGSETEAERLNRVQPGGALQGITVIARSEDEDSIAVRNEAAAFSARDGQDIARDMLTEENTDQDFARKKKRLLLFLCVLLISGVLSSFGISRYRTLRKRGN